MFCHIPTSCGVCGPHAEITMEREGGWGERLCGVFVYVFVMEGSVGFIWRGPRNAIKGVQVLKHESIVCRSSQCERCQCPPCRHNQMAILAVTPA